MPWCVPLKSVVFVLSIIVTICFGSKNEEIPDSPSSSRRSVRIRRAPPKNPFRRDPEEFMSVMEIISHRGYPVESHEVVTSDGYILELHRIPGNNNRTDLQKKGKPIFIQHGLMDTSGRFITSINENSLALQLADRGYDVWLGNSRGNPYSRKHDDLDPGTRAYWDFSWDEIGKYDVTESMLYILQETRRDKVSVICHCFGCAMYFIAATSNPQINTQSEVVVAISPTVRLANMKRPLIKHFVVPFYEPIKWTYQANTFFLPKKSIADISSDGPVKDLAEDLCHRQLEDGGQNRCSKLVHNIDAFKSFLMGMMPNVDHNWPTGSSMRSMNQYVQNIRGRGFNAYDYGEKGNMDQYGTETPLSYDLKLVTAPVYILWSRKDTFATEKDIQWLSDSLGNVKESFEIKKPLGHFAFEGKNTKELIIDPVMKLLPPAF